MTIPSSGSPEPRPESDAASVPPMPPAVPSPAPPYPPAAPSYPPAGSWAQPGPSGSWAPPQAPPTGLPAWSPPRSKDWSVGALIGMGLASIVILAVGVAGPIVGFTWGQAVGRAGVGGSSEAGFCLEDCAVAPSDAPSVGSDGLSAPRDWTIDEDMPFASAPLLSAQTPNGWEVVDTEDGERAAYGERASGCLFIVDEEMSFEVTGGMSDASATRKMIDDYAASMSSDKGYSATTVKGSKPVWVSLNAGDGRVQFAVEQIDYTLADNGEKWHSYLVVRAFTQPATVSYATLDCPASATFDEPFDSLGIQGS